jgi:hypothetical protein
MSAESKKIPIERPSAPRRGDDSFTDLDKLDRAELDEDWENEPDWANETSVRRVRASTPPKKLAGCA